MIKEIPHFMVWEIRQKVMWPDKPLSYVQLEDDENGFHFGLFIQEKLVSIISLFVSNNEAQFRKFATLEEYQGRGYGSLLLKHVISIAKQKGVNRLWCNARINKTSLYEKFEMNCTNERFTKDGQDYVIMEKLLQMNSL